MGRGTKKFENHSSEQIKTLPYNSTAQFQVNSFFHSYVKFTVAFRMCPTFRTL